MNKFDGIPNDEDTKILVEENIKLKQFDAFYQKWHWDGITGESLIFLGIDVEHLDDKELQEEIINSPNYKLSGTLTVQRGEKFTFVNFNFQTS